IPVPPPARTITRSKAISSALAIIRSNCWPRLIVCPRRARSFWGAGPASKTGPAFPRASSRSCRHNDARRGVGVVGRWGKDISRAAHGLDERRIVGIGFELAPQPADLDIDGAVEGTRLAVAREVQQAVPAQYLIGIGDEGGEKIEFAGGKAHLLAIGR